MGRDSDSPVEGRSKKDPEKIYLKGIKRKKEHVFVDLALGEKHWGCDEDLKRYIKGPLEKKDIDCEVEDIPMSKTKFRVNISSSQDLKKAFVFVENFGAEENDYNVYERVDRGNNKYLRLEPKLVASLEDIFGEFLKLFENEEISVNLDYPGYKIDESKKKKLVNKGFDVEEDLGYPEKNIEKSELISTVKWCSDELKDLKKIYLNGNSISITLYIRGNHFTLYSDNIDKVKKSLELS